jgi:hypothetical protein
VKNEWLTVTAPPRDASIWELFALNFELVAVRFAPVTADTAICPSFSQV